MSQGVYKSSDAKDIQLREDLLDLITDLSPTQTPLYTGLGKSTATQNVHEWLRDSVSRASSVETHIEGADVTFSDLASPDRETNYVQEITAPYKVARKLIKSNTVGGNEYDRQRAKAMKSWKLKAEYALVHGTGAEGSSGVAAQMTGLKNAITTNFVSYASGTSLTEERFNDILELAFDDVEEDTFEAYTNMDLKRAISGFTAGSTKNIDAEDRRLVNRVDIYEGDVAPIVKIFNHRDISDGQIIAIQPKAFKVAHLDKPMEMDYPASGPYEAGYIYGSLTLEYREEKAAVRAVNLVR